MTYATRATVRRQRLVAASATFAVLTALLSGCSAPSQERARASAPGVVTVEGPLIGKDAKLLEKSWSGWAKANGITIKYTGSSNFEEQVGTEAQQGNAPDLAIFSQPGFVGDLATRGYLQPLPASALANVRKNFPAIWEQYTTTNGVDYAAPLTATVNGWVFYSPKQFYDLGVSIPSTWTQLLDITRTIQEKTGSAPWCEGFSEGAESGSAGVNWVDDLVLRLNGADVYDQWVTHKIPFNDPRIVTALDQVGLVLKNRAYVNAGIGNIRSINTTTTADVATALESGKCALSHQPSSFVDDLTGADGKPAKVSALGDFWAFPLPPITAPAIPLTGGGTFVSAFSHSADTVKVQAYLSSSAWAAARVRLGGVISPDTSVPAAADTSPLLQEATQLLHNPSSTFRFDASDLMPSIVGEGTFLTGMVTWVAGISSTKTLARINQSWPNN